MLLPAAPWKQELLALHLEELELMWGQRDGAWRSPDWTVGALRKHDARIVAHVDALVLAAEEGTRLTLEYLGKDEAHAVMTAAHVLLSREDAEARALVGQLMPEARGVALDGWRQALRHVSIAPHQAIVERMAASSDERVAVAATSALAFHEKLPGGGRLPKLVGSRDPEVRRQAWEAVGYLGAEMLEASSNVALRDELERCFKVGLDDPEPTVREALLEAAAATERKWLLQHLRERASATADGKNRLSIPELCLFADIADNSDLPLIQRLVADGRLGHERYAIAGASRFVAIVEPVLAAMAAPDSDTARAAATAFLVLTGFDARQGHSLPAVPGDSGTLLQFPDYLAAKGTWNRWKASHVGALRMPAIIKSSLSSARSLYRLHLT